jgi:hypothetical protein
VKAITENHYVDDYIISFKSHEEAEAITKQVTKIHSMGGFNLRNFVSNDKQLEFRLNKKRSDQNHVDLNREVESQTQKVLGMQWNTTKDHYVFVTNYLTKYRINDKSVPTKREFLRLLMAIYDPFGLIANFVHGKMLLQEIWLSKIGWDEKLKKPEEENYFKWINQLERIQLFSEPRCISTLIPEANSVE